MSGAPAVASSCGIEKRQLPGAWCEQCQHLLVGLARAVRANRLDADMVGAGVPMLLYPLSDGVFVAPCNIFVDEPIGAATGEIGIAEAEPPPVVGIVFKRDVMHQ